MKSHKKSSFITSLPVATLWWTYKKLLKMATYSGFSHKEWWFSIAMLVHQGVTTFFVGKRPASPSPSRHFDPTFDLLMGGGDGEVGEGSSDSLPWGPWMGTHRGLLTYAGPATSWGHRWLFIQFNVNPGLINHGLLIRGYPPNSHNMVHKWYPPN